VWLGVMRRYNFGNPDFVEGVASFLERRDPQFAPLPADLELPTPPDFEPHE
jgi:hypothetical protein